MSARYLSVSEDSKQGEDKGREPLEPNTVLFLCCKLLTYNSTESENSEFEPALPGD